MLRTLLREWMPPEVWDWLRRRGGGVRVVNEWVESPNHSWSLLHLRLRRAMRRVYRE